MNIQIHGAGRAGGAFALAAARAGHHIVGIASRTDAHAERLSRLVPVEAGEPDLRIIAVRDDAIEGVAMDLAGGPPTATVHLSGALGVSVLESIASNGTPTGAFHPLQSLPDAETGAASLPGSWIAVTAEEPLASTLEGFARSIGCHPFRVEDDAKPMYHAAASAVANFTVACLGIGEKLFDEAGVPFVAAQPLVHSVVANAFALGPSSAMTGPIARGDVQTVERQMRAVRRSDPGISDAFTDMARATAAFSGAPDAVIEAIG
jgi:predicted short-subunit dehydrogenase-like oxidoreductase (DUF2520 family)